MTVWNEKKFNLGGSDCLVHYSYDLQRESPYSPKRNFGSIFFSKFLLFGIRQGNFGVRLYSYGFTFSITLAPFSIGYIYAP